MAKDNSTPGLPDILGFITSIQQEQQKNERKERKSKKRGRPPLYSNDVLTKVYFTMLTKGIKEFKALWRYLKDNPEIREKCGLKQLPSRTTLSRRMRNFSPWAQRGNLSAGWTFYQKGSSSARDHLSWSQFTESQRSSLAQERQEKQYWTKKAIW